MFTSGAVVSLEICQFSFCSATSVNGGGAVCAYSELHLYVTSFSSNAALGNGYGNDIFTYDPVTVYDTCPNGEGGAPTEGESCL